ncbi:MAG: hypothetical protein WBG17_12755 [Burkholderiaceae bacterium]
MTKIIIAADEPRITGAGCCENHAGTTLPAAPHSAAQAVFP